MDTCLPGKHGFKNREGWVSLIKTNAITFCDLTMQILSLAGRPAERSGGKAKYG